LSEENLKVSGWVRKAQAVGFGLTARVALLSFVAGAAVAVACAQNGTMSPNQGESDGISAGGNWLEFHSDSKMTGAKRVRFELQSNNYFREDPDYKPRVNIYCSDGKYKWGEFNPGVRLVPPNRPGFWGQPQLQVMVRIDDTHSYKGWNWLRGHFLSMDKGTVRGLMSAQIFNVQLPTRSGRQIAEFSPSGLDFGRVKEACDLTAKKPSKD
jgi:hypothetical protein